MKIPDCQRGSLATLILNISPEPGEATALHNGSMQFYWQFFRWTEHRQYDFFASTVRAEQPSAGDSQNRFPLSQWSQTSMSETTPTGVFFPAPPPPPPAPPYIKNKVCLLKKLFLLVNECLIVPSLAVALPGNSGCLTAYLGKILQPQEQRYSFQSLSLSVSQYQCIRYFRVSR